MNHRTVMGAGVIGTAIAVLCCVTPLPWLALGAVGLSAWLAWADWIVLSAFAFFVALAAYGFYLRHKRAHAGCELAAKTTGTRHD
jgi:mercuric ion transport protein